MSQLMPVVPVMTLLLEEYVEDLDRALPCLATRDGQTSLAALIEIIEAEEIYRTDLPLDIARPLAQIHTILTLQERITGRTGWHEVIAELTDRSASTTFTH